MRVLILAPWPYRIPRNGGQLRASAIERAYRAAGHQVYTAGLYHPTEVPQGERWPSDIPIQPGVFKILEQLATHQTRSDMTFWNAVATAPDSFAAFVALVSAVQPEILQFEEAPLWPIVRRLQAGGYLKGVAVVHSSYNFETFAWQHRSVPSAPVSLETMRDIAMIEQEIAAGCDLVIAVSQADAQEFVRLGAVKVCVAANGVTSLSCFNDGVIRPYIASEVHYALFVSSAHPPNAHGLVDLAAGARSHPVRNGEILICGRVGSLVRSASNFQKAGRVINRSRYLGWVDNTLLGALYAGAHVVILPKMYSGGSNLKTAEALASGRPVVATTLAFEGFETFADMQGVIIADDPDVFWTAVNDELLKTSAALSRSPDLMSGLLWHQCLKPMVRAAEDLVQQY